jgi:hypothetical protein
MKYQISQPLNFEATLLNVHHQKKYCNFPMIYMYEYSNDFRILEPYIWIERGPLTRILDCPDHCFVWSCCVRPESPCHGREGSRCCYCWSWRWTSCPRSPAMTSPTADCYWGLAANWLSVVSAETYSDHPPFVETGSPYFLGMSQIDFEVL